MCVCVGLCGFWFCIQFIVGFPLTQWKYTVYFSILQLAYCITTWTHPPTFAILSAWRSEPAGPVVDVISSCHNYFKEPTQFWPLVHTASFACKASWDSSGWSCCFISCWCRAQTQLTQFRPDYHANTVWYKEPLCTLDIQPGGYNGLRLTLNSNRKNPSQLPQKSHITRPALSLTTDASFIDAANGQTLDFSKRKRNKSAFSLLLFTEAFCLCNLTA